LRGKGRGISKRKVFTEIGLVLFGNSLCLRLTALIVSLLIKEPAVKTAVEITPTKRTDF
jgi:hypothetical protein